MADLRKSLGDVYESSSASPPPARPPRRGDGSSGPVLDDDLAEALSAALVSAPGGPGANGVTEPDPTASPTSAAARSRMAGTLREFRRDAMSPPAVDQATPGATAAGPAAPVAAAAAPAPPAAPAVEPLPGTVWRPEQDDILPAGPASNVRNKEIHFGRSRKQKDAALPAKPATKPASKLRKEIHFGRSHKKK
jgi:hypothetical protein